ncbi:hypothetical protein OIDMADRAFT_169794 [Oidiodendron maius Zn]|uniref:Zn(2)-C6 fungal-type domain-containing protein n=1 Tax=Oidiodendron maius (strain Zn) TaxID=913774 RepID=A0A0C3D549_OIDMZ|nr:hypothetical protein OIDMADRAFT_169794 [Oidiodendron maius Zn]
MDRRASSTPGTPAPYGHACVNCAQSKCKCILRREGGPCERCFRSNKHCRPAETVRRRNRRKATVSKTARLEEKLDDLVSLIRAGAQPGAVMLPQVTAIEDDSTPYRTLHSNAYMKSLPLLKPAISNSTVSSDYLPRSGFPDTEEPSQAEAEECLLHFRKYMSKYVPFIYIPLTTNAQQLRQERPFLWLCIMTVASKSTSQQQILGSKIRSIIAQEMVVQSERNVDLLLGILTFASWVHYQFRAKPLLSVLIQLATSLVFDLGLNKPVSKETQVILCVNKCSVPSTPRTMEERRAVLGCFLAASIISSSLQKIDGLRWTAHMDECLQILRERKECPNDEILVELVQLQQIVEKLSMGALSDRAEESADYGHQTSLYRDDLFSKLQGIKATLLAKSENNEIVLLHLYGIEMEMILSSAFLNNNHLTALQRESLNTGFKSLNSWFDVFFAIPATAYIGLTFSIFSQLTRCVITSYRLTTLDDPSWDKNDARNTLDPFLILDRIISNLEQVAVLAGLDSSGNPEGDIFSRSAQMFVSLRPTWEAKLQQGDSVHSTIPSLQSDSEIPRLEDLGVEFFDNDWLMDLLIVPPQC